MGGASGELMSEGGVWFRVVLVFFAEWLLQLNRIADGALPVVASSGTGWCSCRVVLAWDVAEQQ